MVGFKYPARLAIRPVCFGVVSLWVAVVIISSGLSREAFAEPVSRPVTGSHSGAHPVSTSPRKPSIGGQFVGGAGPNQPATASAKSTARRLAINSKSIDWNALDLSDEQATAIDGLEHQWQLTFSQVYPQMRSDQQALRSLLQSKQASENQVMALQERIQDRHDRLRREAMRTFMKKKSYLSSTQQEQLHQMMRAKGVMDSSFPAVSQH